MRAIHKSSLIIIYIFVFTFHFYFLSHFYVSFTEIYEFTHGLDRLQQIGGNDDDFQ